jgi:hypothetical protein
LTRQTRSQAATYRLVARVNARGQIGYTLTNAYSGNNGRAAILNDTARHPVIYISGNAGNGSNPQTDGIIVGAGAQIMTRSNRWSGCTTLASPRGRQLQCHPARLPGRQDRQGHQLPRPDDLQQRLRGISFTPGTFDR